MNAVTEKLTEAEAKEHLTRVLCLLLEARDALPAIPLANARLHNIRLDLADRIERAMEPWRIKE